MSRTILFGSLCLGLLAVLPSVLPAQPEPEAVEPAPLESTEPTAAARPRYALLIDKSGSMETQVDDFGFTRLDIAKGALNFLISFLPADTELSIIAFDETAQVIYGPAVLQSTNPDDPERVAAQGAIQNIEPKGQTSIGAALKLAYEALGIDSSLSDQGDATVLVITDGKENLDPRISEVAQFGCRHFAVGIGKPEDINTAALVDLTSSSSGYFLLSGDPGVNIQLTLEKRFLQILQGFAELQAVQDPAALLKLDGWIDVPFALSEFDLEPLVVLNTPYLGVELTLTSPDGLRVTRDNAPNHGIEFIETGTRTVVRFNLKDNPGIRPGQWTARCAGSVAAGNFWAQRLSPKHQTAWNRSRQTGSVPCMINIFTASPLKLRTDVLQRQFGPGAPIKLRMTLTGQDQIAPGSLAGVVVVTSPRGQEERAKMRRTGDGVYESDVIGREPGVYSMLVQLKGKTPGGLEFTREELKLASILSAEPADRPILDLHQQVINQVNVAAEVTVLDADTRQPIPGADIRLGQLPFQTDLNGGVFAMLPPGTYPMQAAALGYRPTQSVLNLALQPVRTTILLRSDRPDLPPEPNLAPVVLTALDSQTRHPVHDVFFRLNLGLTVSGDHGTARTLLTPGMYRITADARGYTAARTTLFVSARGGHATLLLTPEQPDLPPVVHPVPALVRVYDVRSRELVPGARVEIGDDRELEAPAGVARVSLRPGSYPVTARARGYEHGHATLRVTHPGSSVDVYLRSEGPKPPTPGQNLKSVSVAVFNRRTKQPVPDVTVFIGRDRFPGPSGVVVTRLAPGSYPVRASAPGFERGQTTLSVNSSGGKATLFLDPEPAPPTLQPASLLALDPRTRRPVRGVTFLVDNLRHPAPDGALELRLLPGSYPVVASAKGYETARTTLTVSATGGKATVMMPSSVQEPPPPVRVPATLTAINARSKQPVSNVVFSVEENRHSAPGGSVEIRLMPGNYKVTAISKGFEPGRGTLTVSTKGGQATILMTPIPATNPKPEIPVKPVPPIQPETPVRPRPQPVAVTINVIDGRTKRPVQQATVQVSGPGQPTVSYPVRGNSARGSLLPGQYQVTASASGYTPGSGSLTVSASGGSTTIVLQPIVKVPDVVPGKPVPKPVPKPIPQPIPRVPKVPNSKENLPGVNPVPKKLPRQTPSQVQESRKSVFPQKSVTPLPVPALEKRAPEKQGGIPAPAQKTRFPQNTNVATPRNHRGISQ